MDRPKLKDLLERLARLLEAGVPLAEALDSIAAGLSDEPDLRERLRRASAEVRVGPDVVAAVRRHLAPLSEELGLASEGVRQRIAAVLSRLERGVGGKNRNLDIRVEIKRQDGPAPAAAERAPGQEPARQGSNARRASETLARAVDAGASDVHLEPTAGGGRVRFRLDGVLHVDSEMDGDAYRGLLAGFEELLEMEAAGDAAVREAARSLAVAGRTMFVRACTGPFARGEAMTLRLALVEAGKLPGLDGLGLSAAQLERVRGWLARPIGLIAVTGPSGCGKTTTLYAMLGSFDRCSLKVVTVEQPVEVLLDGVQQLALNPGLGLTWQTALRAQLRHDPDVLMAAEIQSVEVARIVLQSALAGHLVMCAYHAESAVALLGRMAAIGLEPHLLVEAGLAILAQRLLRRLCPDCSEPCEEAKFPGRLPQGVELPAGQYRRARGCASCRNTGFRGRLAAFELLEPTHEVMELVSSQVLRHEIEARLARAGHRTLLEDALDRAAAGQTTLEEVARTCLV